MKSEPTMILEARVPDLEKALALIAKRAKKLGVAPPTVTLTGRTEIREQRQPRSEGLIKTRWAEVIVEGETPRLPGWTLIAVVSHEDNVVDVIPGESCPKDQRERGPVCDHCGRRDYSRKKTMVLRDEAGKVVQVGTTCIGDFLGATKFDPQRALTYVTLLLSVLDGFSEDAGESAYGGYGGRQIAVEEIEPILLWTGGWLADNPWVSGAKAAETHSVPTRSCVIELVWPPIFTGRDAAKH